MEQKKILVVDDEPLIFDSIEDTLGDEYQLLYAENGQAGLEQFKKHQPNLVILDMRMPVMDGIEFLKQIRVTEKDHFAIIAISGHAGGQEIGDCFDNGISAFLSKPFNVFELKGLVKQCLSTKNLLAKLDQQYKELDYKEKYIRCVVDCSLGILVSLDASHNIVEFNSAAEKIFGVKASTVKGSSFANLFTDKNNFSTITNILDTGQIYTGQVNMRKNDGRTFPAFLKFSTLHGVCGELGNHEESLEIDSDTESPGIVGVVGSIRDISYDQKIAKLMKHKNDLETVKITATTMADNIKNKLNGLMLLRDCVDSKKSADKQTLDIFDQSVDDIVGFLNKLLDLKTLSTVSVGGVKVLDVDGRYTKKHRR